MVASAVKKMLIQEMSRMRAFFLMDRSVQQSFCVFSVLIPCCNFTVALKPYFFYGKTDNIEFLELSGSAFRKF